MNYSELASTFQSIETFRVLQLQRKHHRKIILRLKNGVDIGTGNTLQRATATLQRATTTRTSTVTATATATATVKQQQRRRQHTAV